MPDSETWSIPIPNVVHNFFAKFPLYTYPTLDVHITAARNGNAVLWIHPPTPDIILPSTNLLSKDVECLKWQAYIALRGLKDIDVRWDISPFGSVDGRLPALQTQERSLLSARMIPGWVDGVLGLEYEDAFEGYKDDAAKDESRAWVSLLEGPVHIALIMSMPTASYAAYISSDYVHQSLSALLNPPFPSLTGVSSLISPYGERVSPTAVHSQYCDAIAALSERLGHDGWFLGSSGPTALDALVFAYIHCLLASPEMLRSEVNRRANLVAWERRVKILIQSAFKPYHQDN